MDLVLVSDPRSIYQRIDCVGWSDTYLLAPPHTAKEFRFMTAYVRYRILSVITVIVIFPYKISETRVRYRYSVERLVGHKSGSDFPVSSAVMPSPSVHYSPSKRRMSMYPAAPSNLMTSYID
jgi:hypothetical protein